MADGYIIFKAVINAVKQRTVVKRPVSKGSVRASEWTIRS